MTVDEKAKTAYVADAVAAYKQQDAQQFGLDESKYGQAASFPQFEQANPNQEKIASHLSDMWDSQPFYKDGKKMSENDNG